VLLLLPSQAMVEDWIPSTIMQDHLQSLMSQGFMMATELMTHHVPEDPMFPTPAEGNMVSFVGFYEWEFGVPSHRFLCSLL
jgi:hypothetical protein